MVERVTVRTGQRSQMYSQRSRISSALSHTRFVLCLSIVLAFASCGEKGDSTTPVKPDLASPPPIAAPPATVLIAVKSVDMDGKPLANMQPIATKTPNAFDVPLATGELTGADGASSLRVPSDTYLYVRAWDPAKRWFANNYYDVLPGSDAPREALVVTMLPGATLDVEVMGNDGAPVVSQPIGMMMSHPVYGPWWPSETHTDEQGRAQFGPVPPGKYAITIEARDHRHVDLAEQTLLPGKTTHAGPVTLR